jgi:hypothetical protein
MQRICICLGIAFLLSAITGESKRAEAVETQTERTIITKRGVPLATQLLPSDQIVLVKRGAVPGTEDGVSPGPLPNIDDEVESLKQRGNSIVIAEVLRTEGILVEGDSWINTRVTILRDRTVVDGRESIFDAQNTAGFDQDGGEVIIKGVTLRVVSNNYLFEPGEKYLLTLQRMYDGRVALASVPFRVKGDGTVAPIRVSAGSIDHPSNFYGMPIDAVIQQLRRD